MEQNTNLETPTMKYKVRAGTIDSGKKYEYKMAALLCLRCVLSKEDMWISSNADGVGAFDDIVLRYGTKTFLLQLKHMENPKPVLEREFSAPKSDFFLSKYLHDITQLKQNLDCKSEKSGILSYLGAFDNLYFIIFTNRDVKGSEFLKESLNDELTFLNTKANSNAYRIDVENNCGNMYFLSEQVMEKHIDDRILEEIDAIAQQFDIIRTNTRTIAENFTKYVTDWAEGVLGGHYCLTKRDVITKLTDLFLSQYESKLSEQKYSFYTCEKKLIWNKIMTSKTLSLVDANDAIDTFLFEYIASEVRKCFTDLCTDLWLDPLPAEVQNIFYQKNLCLKTHMLKIIGNQGKITLVNVYKSMWMTNQLPLLLEVNKSHECNDILNILKLSDYQYKAIVINKGTDKLECSDQVNLFYTLDDLNLEDRNRILAQPVRLQGRSSVALMKLVEVEMLPLILSSDIIHILLGEFNIGDCLSPLPHYFVARKFSKVLLQFNVLNEVRHEVFVIEQSLERRLNTSAMQHSNIHSIKDFDTDILGDGGIFVCDPDSSPRMIKMRSSNKSVHYLRVYSNNLLEWKASFGSTDSIKQYRDDIVDEARRSPLSAPITIISAAPGMGKSMLMDDIAHRIPATKWVLRIDLNKHTSYYLRQTNASNHLEYFGQENTTTSLSKAIFTKLAKSKDIVVLLDGFDEVSVSYKNQVTDIAKYLFKEQYSMWITTRPHMRSHLEAQFGTFSIGLNSFSLGDQKEFLAKYFGFFGQEIFVNKFVEKLLKIAAKNLKVSDIEFTGIPLQTRLLADVFYKECKIYVDTQGASKFEEEFDLLYLYESFINGKIEISAKKYGHGAIDTYKSIFRKDHQLFALKHLLGDCLEHLIVDINKSLNHYYKEDLHRTQLLQREGVLTLDESFNISFAHQTFAEYLTAEWLAENCQSGNELAYNVVKQRFTPDYTFLFKIFDRLVCKNFPLHLAVINREADKAVEVIESSPNLIDSIDACGRSVLHLVGLYGTQYPAPFFGRRLWHNDSSAEKLFIGAKTFDSDPMMLILNNVSEGKQGNDKADVFGYNPLDYALANRSFTIANELCRLIKPLIIGINLNLNSKTNILGFCILLNYRPLIETLVTFYVYKDLLLKNVQGDVRVGCYLKSMFECTDIQKEVNNFKMDFEAKTLLEVLQSNGRFYSGWMPLRKRYIFLHSAVVFDSLPNVRELLPKCQDINQTDYEKNTSLHYAALHGKSEMCNLLLATGANVNLQNLDRYTPLHFAILHKHYFVKPISHVVSSKSFIQKINCCEIVPMLIGHGANVNLQDHYGNTPLHLSLTFGQTCCTTSLFSAGIDQNIKNTLGKTAFDLITEETSNKNVKLKTYEKNLNVLLLYAVENNDLLAVNQLLSNGADIKTKNKMSQPVLHIAAQKGFDKLLTEMLAKGADIDAKDDKGYTPLQVAIFSREFYTARVLISNGANVMNGTTMHVAAQIGNCDILTKLLAKGASIEGRDSIGNTPIAYAVLFNKFYATEFLISKGANVNITNNNGLTLLHLAAKSGSCKIVELILTPSADINAQDLKGYTPLLHALKCKKQEAAKLLILRGASLTIKNHKSFTPAHLAAKRGYNIILNQMLVEGIEINAQNKYSQTPLDYAVRYNRLETVQILVSNGAKGKNLDLYKNYMVETSSDSELDFTSGDSDLDYTSGDSDLDYTSSDSKLDYTSSDSESDCI